MKLAVICCANGLGHLKRSVQILSAFVRIARPKKITVFCEGSSFNYVRSWSEWLALIERCSVHRVEVSLPVRWRDQPQFYDEWLSRWHRSMEGWRLDDFDHVLSDNLIEPLYYSDRVILTGSFFWHDILSSAFPGHGSVGRYAEACRSLLAARKPHVLANRYFVMPAVREQSNLHTVGMIPSGRTRATARRRSKRVLIALGSAQELDDELAVLARAVLVFQEAGMTVAASQPVYVKLVNQCPGMETFDFLTRGFAKADFAIIRGGMGTVSDCVAARVPMLYLKERNSELAFNQGVLSRLGIGASLEEVLETGIDGLVEESGYSRMVAKMAELGIDGAMEAARILADVSGVLNHDNLGAQSSGRPPIPVRYS